MLDFLKKVFNREEKKDIPPAYSPYVEAVWPTSTGELLASATEINYKSFVDLVQRYGSAYIFACVNKLGNSVRLYRPKIAKRLPNGGLEELHDSKIIKKLKRPNTQYGFPTLLEATAISLALTGNAYWEIVKVKGHVVGFFVLQPQRMVILKDEKTNKLAAYEYDLGNKKVRFNPEDIIHFKIYNIQDDYYGLSPLVAADLPHSVLKDVNKFLQNYFKQGGIFRGVLETDKTLTKHVYDRLTERFKQLYTGVGRAFVVPILESGLKFKPVQVLPKDSQAFESADFSLKTLLAVFQVNPVLLGFEKGNHAVLRELRAMYWEDTVVPFVSRIEEALNAQKEKFMPTDELDYDIVFDSSQIEALKVNELLKARIAVGYGALTINEVRSRLFGLPPREGGDVALLPLNMVPVETALDNTPGVPKPKKDIEPEVKGKQSPIFQTKAEWELYHSTVKILIEEEIYDIFLEQFKKTSGYLTTALTNLKDKDLVEAKVEEAINGTFTSIKLTLERTIDVKTFNIYFGILNKLNPELALLISDNQKIKKFSKYWATALTTIVNDTTKRQLVKEITSLEPTEDLELAINKVFSKLVTPIVGQRLKLISHTEATRLINFASYLAHKDAGYTHKIWKCFEYHKSRHKELHNKKLPIYADYDINGEKAAFPCDVRLSAYQTCNCSCRLIYTKED